MFVTNTYYKQPQKKVTEHEINKLNIYLQFLIFIKYIALSITFFSHFYP